MIKLNIYILLVASSLLLWMGCSNKSSDEACKHETTMNLDTGNFDAVLSSGCADAMQRGAAYFGKAGFDIANVINRFSETGSSVKSGQDTTSGSLSIYMNALVGKVNGFTLTYIDSAKGEYAIVTQTAPVASSSYKDAYFYIAIADAVKSLSLLKIILDPDGDGDMNSSCDKNANEKPDEVDAMSCGLYTAAAEPCPTGTNVELDQSPLTLEEQTGYTFRGLVISVSGAGTNSATCPVSNEYLQLLYLQTAAATPFWTAVATVPGTPACHGSDGKLWPCPIIQQNGQPLDLVTTIDASLTNAVDSMNTALQPISGATVTSQSDVETSLQDIKDQACPSGPCTSGDIADYLQTY